MAFAGISFEEYFGVPEHDPCRDDTGALDQEKLQQLDEVYAHDPTLAVEVAEETALIFSEAQCHGAVVLHVGDNTEATITFVHGVQRHVDPFGGRTRNHDQYFGIVGDVCGQCFSATGVDLESAFGMADDMVTVYNTPAQLRDYFAANPAVDLVGELTDNDVALYKTSMVRRSAFVPYCLLGSVWPEAVPKTAKNVFLVLYDRASHLGIVNRLTNLWEFLAASVTEPGNNDPVVTLIPTVGPSVVSPRVMEALRSKQVATRLPALYSPGNAGGALAGANTQVTNAITSLTATVGTFLTVQEANLASKARKADSKKTIAGKYGSLVEARLLHLFEANSTADIPEIYADLAKAPKNTHKTIISVALHKAALDFQGSKGSILGLSCTVHFKNALSDCMLVDPTNPSQINGLSAFDSAPPTIKTLRCMTRAANDQELLASSCMMESGSTTTTLSDTRTISAQRPFEPINFLEAEEMMRNYLLRVIVALGILNRATIRVREYYDSYVRLKTILQPVLLEKYTTEAAASTMLVYLMHRSLRKWILLQSSSDTPVEIRLPDLDQVAEGDSSLLQSTIVVTGLETVPIPPTLAPANPAGASPPGAGQRKSNTNMLPVFSRTEWKSATAGVTIGQLIQNAAGNGVPIPSISGQEICLWWHTKGKCKSDCQKRATHVVLTNTTKDNLFAWCRAAAPTAATVFPEE